MNAMLAKDVHQIRRDNYIWLYTQFRDARLHEPDKGMLRLWAAHLNDRLRAAQLEPTSPAYLSHVRNGRKEIGNDLARKIETAMGLPYGWMDADHTGVAPETEEEARFIETALSIYRASPQEAQTSLLEYLRGRLLTVSGDAR